MTHLQTAPSLGVRHIGLKDVGLPLEDLKSLNKAIQAKGATLYLEVVSLDKESEVASARAAVDIGIDVLLGGTRVDDVLPVLSGSGLQYYPFIGELPGHPSALEGTIEEIAASVADLASRDGVHGLDLLAYRSPDQNVPQLIETVCQATGKPVIVAGSIAGQERIAAVYGAGAAGFTIGTMALDEEHPANGKRLEAQLTAILRDFADLTGHLSLFGEKGSMSPLEHSVKPGRRLWQVNDMQIRLTKFAGPFTWHFHERRFDSGILRAHVDRDRGVNVRHHDLCRFRGSIPSLRLRATGSFGLIVLRNSVSAQSLSISQNSFPLKRRSRNDVCQGGLSAKHVPVFRHDSAVTAFFNTIGSKRTFNAAASNADSLLPFGMPPKLGRFQPIPSRTLPCKLARFESIKASYDSDGLIAQEAATRLKVGKTRL
nr:hypothetical protein [Roseovarius sp. MMSF_3281]